MKRTLGQDWKAFNGLIEYLKEFYDMNEDTAIAHVNEVHMAIAKVLDVYIDTKKGDEGTRELLDAIARVLMR